MCATRPFQWMENTNTTMHIQIPVQFYLHVGSCLSNDLKIAILENKLVIDLLSSVHTQSVAMQFGCITVNIST